ncbi:MAG: GH3 auxin-responsive promoter family protein [Candidatus Binatia bacterium]
MANSLWLASGLKAARVFRRALREPRKAQEAILMSLLLRNANSSYGGRYSFHRLRSIRDYQDAVPIVSYDSLEQEIEAIKRGRQGILTEEPVLMLEKTAGSTAASKYIPYTASLKREFQAAVAPWMADLYSHRPKMLFGGAYWSVSPLATGREVTEGGLPVGFEDDTEYLGTWERRLLSRLLLTPKELPRVLDVETSRYVTLRFLLETPRLSFISIWNPSFLTLLIQFLSKKADRLLEDVRRGTLTPPALLPSHLHLALSKRLHPRPKRANRLEQLLNRHGTLPPSEAWPPLAVISCWASASAARFLPEMQSLFPKTEIQPKGLLATEGAVSIPLTGHPGAALVVTSHFLEFIDEENPRVRPLLADELDLGRTYSVLITTGGGLYRYALGDRVHVVGRIQATALVEFVGKVEQISDLCGEKLNAARIEEILDQALREFQIEPSFVMLAPEWGRPPRYILFLEAQGLPKELFDKLVLRVETRLAEGHHYAYCRQLGQLGPLQGFRLLGGASRAYLERCALLGQRRGSVKPTALHSKPGWSDWFLETSPESLVRE